MTEWPRKTLFLSYHLPLPTSSRDSLIMAEHGKTGISIRFEKCLWGSEPFWSETFLWIASRLLNSFCAHCAGGTRAFLWGSGTLLVFSLFCCFMWRGVFKSYLLFYKHIFHVVEGAPSSCIPPLIYISPTYTCCQDGVPPGWQGNTS